MNTSQLIKYHKLLNIHVIIMTLIICFHIIYEICNINSVYSHMFFYIFYVVQTILLLTLIFKINEINTDINTAILEKEMLYFEE